MLTSDQIRRQFLDFFRSKGHEIVDSSPVVPPADDPSLKDTFTNAGMNQFKDVFLGTGSRPYVRAADTQKCIRAGGKHNDLDDVGQDTYHHTFFEMLGNWSFGDYFKKEAIEWAWELLTKVWGIENGRLYATYFQGDTAEGLEPDSEAARLWREVTDIEPSHIVPGNKKDNFWEMGDTGPCGPCSEIHIDLTPDKSGGPLVNTGDAQVMEIWNLVFIQYNRGAQGKLTPLPAKHVDTGMGFERLCAVLQGMAAGRIAKFSNYDTDVFTPIFTAIQKRTGAPDYQGTLPSDAISTASGSERADQNRDREGAASDRDQGTEGSRDQGIEGSRGPGEGNSDTATKRRSDEAGAAVPLRPSVPSSLRPSPQQVMLDVSYRVIADHIRTLTFAITDGALPSNEGRGYVLRRILRRAVVYGRQYMDMHEPFLCDLVKPLVNHMREVFPELRTGPDSKRPRDNVEHVAAIIRDEESSFFKTVDRGIERFEHVIMTLVGRTIRTFAGLDFLKAIGASVDDGPLTWTLYFGPIGPGTPRIELGTLASGQYRAYLSASLVFPGGDAFALHDTYGFPLDLTQLMAEKYGLTVDTGEHERLMKEARQRARGLDEAAIQSARGADERDLGDWKKLGEDHLRATRQMGGAPDQSRGGHDIVQQLMSDDRLRPRILNGECPDEFKYTQWRKLATYITGNSWPVFVSPAESLSNKKGARVRISTATTCFYAEQGGQVCDRGWIRTTSGEIEITNVLRNKVKLEGRIVEIITHEGFVEDGEVWNGPCTMGVYPERRIPTMQHHTSTHILNLALREVLCPPEERENPHVQQKGSLVDPEKTRFDFSHPKPLTDDELLRVEDLCNEQIRANLTVYAASREEDFVDQQKAREINTLRAVFGEKYPDKVRVVSIGVPIEDLLRDPKNAEWLKYSVEFCGGTHVKNTSEIGSFVLTHEEGVAKGVRRVVGIAGELAAKAQTLGAELLSEARALSEPPTSVGADSPVSTPAPAPKGPPKASPAAGTIGEAERPRGLKSAARHGLPERLADFQRRLADPGTVVPLRVRRQIQVVLADLQKQAKEHEKQSAAASGEAVMDAVAHLLESAETVNGITIVVGEVPLASSDALRGAIDWVRNKTAASAVLLAYVEATGDGDDPSRDRGGAVSDPNRDREEPSRDDPSRAREEAIPPPLAKGGHGGVGKVTLVAGMSKAAVDRGLEAGDLIKEVSPLVGGKGGGRPDMAQGGGPDAAGLAHALAAARAWIGERAR